MNQLIRCTQCDAIFLRTPFDQWPEYELSSSLSPDSFRRMERDDFKVFLGNHRGHRLEELKIIEDSFVSEKAYAEPVKISYFKATNGKEHFVVKKSRDQIGEPLKYQLIHGDLSLRCTGIGIQAEAIRKELEREFKAKPVPQTKIAAFLKLYQRIAETADINGLERVPEESPHPLEMYYKTDDISLAYLLRNCRNIFNGKEYQDIEAFIHRNKDDGVLLLKANYLIEIIDKAKSKKEATSVSHPLELDKAVEKK